MLIEKKIVTALIRARLNALERQDTPDPSLANEFRALQVAIDDVMGVTVTEGTALQKADPMETAIDMVGLKIRQLLDAQDPHRFVGIQRMSKLAQLMRREAGTRVGDFAGCGAEDEMGPNALDGELPNYGRVNPVAGYAMGRGAPYGMAENPEGPQRRQYDVNDLYREAISALQPMIKTRAAESAAAVRRDGARELKDLQEASERAGRAGRDTAAMDARIAELESGGAEGAPADLDPDDLPRPPDRRQGARPWEGGIEVEAQNLEGTGVPGLQMRDPECEHCTEFPPIVIRGRRVHAEDEELVDCATVWPTAEPEGQDADQGDDQGGAPAPVEAQG